MKNTLIAHNVYFKLINASDAEIDKFIRDCHKFLKPIEGIIYFAAGRLHSAHDREVNVQDFHVGTHVTFRDQASHDNYQICALHEKFVDANKANWESVRVFDWIPDYDG